MDPVKITINKPIGEFTYKIVECKDSLKYHTWVEVEARTPFGNIKNGQAFWQTTDKMLESFNLWKQGHMVQNAFPYLNPDEREWLLTAGAC